MSTLVEYKKKKVIFNEGDESDCMYGVTEGSVGIYSDYGTSKEKQLVTLQCGDYFGEMGMIERLPLTEDSVHLFLFQNTPQDPILKYWQYHHKLLSNLVCSFSMVSDACIFYPFCIPDCGRHDPYRKP